MEHCEWGVLIPLSIAQTALFWLVGCNRPDVIVITLDTLRVDHVGAFASDSPALTPNIDALAQDGVRYTNCYSPISVTGPAFVTLHTGQDPGTHKVIMNVFRGGTFLKNKAETLAEKYQHHRYETGGFVSGFTLRRSLGLAQGFDTYDTPPKTQNRRWGNKTAFRAIKWLEKQSGPVFLWYHSYDAHGPWNRWSPMPKSLPELTPEAQAEYDEILSKTPAYQLLENVTSIDSYKARYARSVEFADKQVGKIIDSLKKSDRYDNSIIVLTADHGESFDERELWFDHGTTPHEEQLHVPLIIKYPNRDRAGQKDMRLIGLKDIAPTLLSVAGLSAFKKADGHDLTDQSWQGWSVLSGESSHCKKEKPLSCTPLGPSGKSFGVRSLEHSAFLFPTALGDKSYGHLLKSDPTERKQVAVTDSLKSELQNLSSTRRTSVADIIWPPPKAKSDDQSAESIETEMLKSLGYIDADE